jgi:hypothetical protein
LIKGAFVRRASLRATSVFPTPVGPIMIMFLGSTSSLRSSGSLCLLQRFLRAMATAFLALSWPIMYLSSSSTVFLGVRLSIKFLYDDLFVRVNADIG